MAADEPTPFMQMISEIVAEEKQAVFEGEIAAQMAEDALNTDVEATAIAQFFNKLRAEGLSIRSAERMTEAYLYVRAGMAAQEVDDEGEEV